jgi:3-deoxy-D-manno-octulosonate 8-phosphate phosphatase KdsC-like HAD superfamily phosphatase
MKISFDVDGVLTTPQGMALARRKIANGDRVYIITARNESTMSARVYEIAKELGIPRLRVYFTNGADKWKTIQSLGIELHIDNNEEQVNKIKENTDTRAELVSYD